ncbi:cytochrome P450 3A24-like isoform X1 [Mytilus galloprovincialis]|uniref:cytochrome P450 3A24-like isoform X1 n=2 Tax=Mytilus galloprovincialis TaxID=29158 RepID=UPI003F7B86CD
MEEFFKIEAFLNTWLLVIVLTVVLLLIYSTFKTSVLREFPGPRPIPFLGILPQMIKKGFHGLDIELVKKYGRVVGTYVGHFPSILISDPDMIKEIWVRDFKHFSDRPELAYAGEMAYSAVTLAKGEHWKFLRHVLSPSFSPAKLKQMFSSIEDCSDQLIYQMKKQSQRNKHVNMEQICQGFSMDVICGTAFGLKVDSQENPNNEFIKMAKEMTSLKFSSPLFLLQAFFPELRHVFSKFEIRPFPSDAIDFFMDITKTAIQKRKDNKMTRPDFLQLMINNYKGERDADIKNGTIEMYKQRGITETEILANSLIFFLDGYDTTASGLIFSIYRMAVHQEFQERLFKEIDHEIGKDSPRYEQILKLPYLDMFFCEVMRMYPPSTRTNRKTMQSVTVNGYRIPDGVEVTVPIYAMHYDPELWPEPENFFPERFSAVNKEKRNPYSYMPFGHGPRNCIGMRLANLETKMAMVRILQHFRLKPTPDMKIPIELDNTSGGILRPKNPVYVMLEPR